jgi:hypothetical protein
VQERRNQARIDLRRVRGHDHEASLAARHGYGSNTASGVSRKGRRSTRAR